MPQTVWPIQYNWANNFLLNSDGKSPISCPDQQGMSIIAFSVRGGFFLVGPGDWMWVRAWSWWEEEVCRGIYVGDEYWNVWVTWMWNFIKTQARLVPGNLEIIVHLKTVWVISDIDVKQTPLDMHVHTNFVYNIPGVYTIHIYMTMCS